MNLHSIPDILRADPHDSERQLVLAALHEAIHGTDGPATKRYHQVDAQRKAAHEERMEARWKSWGTVDSAVRFDGIEVRLGDRSYKPGADPTELVPWIVSFPAMPGDAQPSRSVKAAALDDALAQVDERWPMAEWWPAIRAQRHV